MGALVVPLAQTANKPPPSQQPHKTWKNLMSVRNICCCRGLKQTATRLVWNHVGTHAEYSSPCRFHCSHESKLQSYILDVKTMWDRTVDEVFNEMTGSTDLGFNHFKRSYWRNFSFCHYSLISGHYANPPSLHQPSVKRRLWRNIAFNRAGLKLQSD